MKRIIEVPAIGLTKPIESQRNIIPWHLKKMANLEKWWLRKFYHLNPECERIVRFYTECTDKVADYNFKCTNYTYDLFSCLYDDFVETSCEIGKKLMDLYEGVCGEYYYDVKISLQYFQSGSPIDGYDWDMEYTWEIIETNNPRCVAGSARNRKDCSQFVNKSSRMEIEGYKLNGNYKRLVELLSDLTGKTVIVHSKFDASAFLRIVKYLGVEYVSINGKQKKNIPSKCGYFSERTFGYQLYMNPQTRQVAVMTVTKNNLPSNCYDLLDIDELIIKRSLKARLRDM